MRSLLILAALALTSHGAELLPLSPPPAAPHVVPLPAESPGLPFGDVPPTPSAAQQAFSAHYPAGSASLAIDPVPAARPVSYINWPKTSTAITSSNPDHPYICRVQTWDSDGARSWGSGALVEEEAGVGYVLTAKHVLNSQPLRIMAHFPDGTARWAAVHSVANDADVALLRIAETGISPAVLRDEDPALGETLYVAGYGGDGTIRFARGRASLRYVRELALLGCRNRQGDSGGPILDALGRLCGVAWGTDGQMVMASRLAPVRRVLGRVGALLPPQLQSLQSPALNCPTCVQGSGLFGRILGR